MPPATSTIRPWTSTGLQVARRGLWLAGLIGVLALEGAALTHAYLWAAPLLCVLVVAVAVDVPLVPVLAVVFTFRVLSDASLSSSGSRHTGSLNPSAAIAFLFILIGLGLILRRRRALLPASAALLFLCLGTVVAVGTTGASSETFRQGAREASVVALAVLVCNSGGALNLSMVTRVIQLAGIGAALLALYQLATHGGVNVAGQIRSNGTFIHPNGAAMYFAIATTVSLWRYLDYGRRRSDVLLTAIFALATVSTFSFTGLAALSAMLIAFGGLRPGSFRLKARAFSLAALIIAVFLATPLGSQRLANETSTSVNAASAQNSRATTSFAWRIDKWRELLPKWERSPLVGQGLGTTVTEEGAGEEVSENGTVGSVPHNEYLRYLVETGVIGLAALLTGLFVMTVRLARRRRTPGMRDGAALGMAVLAGCLVNALADNTLLYTTTGYAAALVLAAVLSSPAAAAGRYANGRDLSHGAAVPAWS